jgi:hypothetical protein
MENAENQNTHWLLPGIEATCSWLEGSEHVGRGEGLLHSMIMIDELCVVVRGIGLNTQVRTVARRVMELNYRFNNMPITEHLFPIRILFN